MQITGRMPAIAALASPNRLHRWQLQAERRNAEGSDNFSDSGYDFPAITV
jgi:hypothetical protein